MEMSGKKMSSGFFVAVDIHNFVFAPLPMLFIEFIKVSLCSPTLYGAFGGNINVTGNFARNALTVLSGK
jgi:hypothetical protein